MKVQLREFEFEVQGDEQFWNGVDSWEPETFDIVKRYADPSKSFIDIGAWNGVVSLYASQLFNNVVAIEPDTVAFEKLLKNIELNPCWNVSCQNVAISNTNGNSMLNLSLAGDSMSSLLPRDTEQFPTVNFHSVETKRFGEINRGSNVPIGLIKMDIEGGEILVIPDMLEFLEDYKPPIYISFHPFWFPENEKNAYIVDFADYLFGIYRVVRDGQFNLVTKDEFINGMLSNSFTYVFDTK